jgi:hypothetical protein
MVLDAVLDHARQRARRPARRERPHRRFDVRTSFGLRGPETLWQNFLLPTPPPLYHDIFAMIMRVPDLVLEGDTLVAMQNARALHRMMNVMREVR